MAGRVEAIFVASKGGAPMVRADEARAVQDAGLEGDRYARKIGYWTNVDECQVTMIEGEVLDRIAEADGVSVANGEHRRNIVTRGIELETLVGKTFRVGEAVMVYDRPRPPCTYIESITEPGMTKALGGTRGGICVRVLTTGEIRPDDEIRVAEGA